jgi:hypothetical protein
VQGLRTRPDKKKRPAGCYSDEASKRWETVAMGDPSLPLRANDIEWTPDLIPRVETIPQSGTYLAHLSHAELLDYVADLREEAATLRKALHVAIAAIARLTAQLKRAQETIVRLHEHLRDYRRAA